MKIVKTFPEQRVWILLRCLPGLITGTIFKSSVDGSFAYSTHEPDDNQISYKYPIDIMELDDHFLEITNSL